MTTLNHRAEGVTSVNDGTESYSSFAHRALATLRIAFGLTFLWAFVDKMFALGFHTGYDAEGNLDRFGDAAWINGGSPTEGFLKYGADGPFDSFYHSIAGAAWADWLFMLGLVTIGLALTFGHRNAHRRDSRRRPLPHDVERRPASREQPAHRRPHPRGPHPGRPCRLQRRQHLGPRAALVQDRAGPQVPGPAIALG